MPAPLPPICIGAPDTLLHTITATAPAAWQLSTFWLKLQFPLSTKAILPLMELPLVKPEQASLNGLALSCAITTLAVIPLGQLGKAGPNAAGTAV